MLQWESPRPAKPPLRTLNYYSCRDSVDRLATRGPLICGCPGIPTAARLQTRGSWPTFCRNRRKVIPFDYPRLLTVTAKGAQKGKHGSGYDEND
ncbi:hypothetical protein AFLA_013701 [Aspergillus flavus NRRL3357]|nr:hypothetical protein AFLA_013701 [Aspergillus flavus NRRL3357]